MEENSKVYRIRTKVGEDSPNVIHVPINQTYDTFEILSLKLNQTDTYKTYESGYGIIVGRVIANGGFGVPNSKVSVFIEVDDNESLKDTLLYNFTSTSDTDNNGVRYNLLPDYVEAECHQDVGTFPNKRLVLDNDDVIEIFDKYWKYTTTTNNSGDYMLFGIPTGSQQLHVDIDLSDCGVLSQRPHNMIGKGYDIGMFESPNKFKSSTNLNSLPQIVTEDRGVYVYPYWGDTSNGDNTFAITRCDINIEYKFEPTAVFMGCIITDKGSNAIGKNCTATINNGKMSELVTGEGTIEMIRKTIDGRVEQFPIMGNRLIDGDGTWVYEIPMNLDYVTTDEFGNFVPTDNPDKGIATRARVRFRVRLDDTQYDNTARKRACYLIPNNPRLEDEGFDKTMEVDYEFGSLTREESYRDLFWNKVYTVKSYIPKIQKGDEQYNRQHTGIKWVNHANQNNPMPYNTLTVKLSFVHRIICILTNLVVQFVAFINQIISLLGFLFATLFDLPSVIFNGLARLLEDTICLPWPLSDVCVGDLLAQIFYGIGKGLSSINILGRMATKFLTPRCIVLDSGFCDDNVNKIDFYPGCGYFLFNLFPLSSATDVVERGDIAWEKTQEAQQEKYNGKSSDEVRTASNHTGELHNCYENALAQENEATSFNFNNDWINGTLYAPLWYRKITPKKRFFFGLFSRKAKDEWCTSKQYFPSLRYIQHCAVERDGSKTITNFDGDTTDLKFIRNSECDGDCHERHVALPGLGGVIHSKKTMLGQDVYYYKPVEWSANLPSNELYRGKKKGELKLLFATDIVLLGSLDSCDMNGIPQFFKNLESTTYNMPGDILFTDYEFHYIIDPETGDATSNYNTQDYKVHSEMAGCDWGNPNEFNRGDGGLFYGIGCTNGETKLYAKSCVNLSRICEYGVSLDVTKQIPILEKWNEETSESEIEQAEDGAYYKRLITDGFISWDELYNLDERSMFATMNGNQLKTKINTKNGLKEYDFRYLYPENFDGSLAERMKRQTQNYPPEVNYKFNYLLEKASRDYYLFRMGNKPYYYDSNNAFPRYENSFYFYFGLNEGKTAIEKFNSKYFAECNNEKGVYNNFNIYKKSSSWCSSLNNTYDGFIALDLEKIATPYSIVITGDNTFTLDNISDEKIIFYNNEFYSRPEGFEDYTKRELNNGVGNIPIIPNGAYYLTITDANEEEYHYELDMSYNFLMYSNNVQSFKKNHEDLLRSLGTNNAIMNDNTKLVYSNPEKIEREIGGVITVYGVHDNDGDIDTYRIEVREKVDFDITDIQKTIEKEGDIWYDADGEKHIASSEDVDTIVKDYASMTKKLVVPEWYDKDAVKHYLTEKDEGTQQADFKPLVKKLEKDSDTWYDADGKLCEVTSIIPQGKEILTIEQWGSLTPTEKEWYVEVYVKENGEEIIILTKEQWDELDPDEQANYTKKYRNKVIIIHYTKNGEEEDEEHNPYTIVGRNTVVDYTDWTLELNLPTYYNKNGEKQYYSYQPNKETSVVDFELSDRLKKLTTWYDEDGNFFEVTSVVPQDEEILTFEQWNSLSTEEKTLYDEVYINKQDSNVIIDAEVYDELPEYNQDCYDEVYVNRDDETVITKEQWEALAPDVRANYAKMYRNKYDENDIIAPEDWVALPTDYCKSDYSFAYNFNRNGLHNVRIYLAQKTTYGDLLNNFIDFNGCSDLNTIVLPNIGITTIGTDVFSGCKSLTSIDLPDSITAIGNNAFNGCEKLSSVYIPYNVKTIGNSAFKDCKSLTNIVLPKNITTIGDNAFANCEKLQSVRAEMEDVTNNTVGTNAFDNTNIGLIIYVPMDKDGKTYDDSTTSYNKAGWGDDVQDKVVAIELTVFNYNKVNINPNDLLDEFARNTSGNTNGNTVYYNFIDSYVAGEYKAFTQVTYFKASDFVNAINNVLSRRREIADRMFNTFYMTQEGESKSFNITSNTDEMPVQPIIVYHEEEIDDVDIDYTLTTPNLTYEQINMLKNVNIPTITYKSSPFFGDGTSSDEIMITKSNNIEKKPSSTGIMNVKQKSIPLDSGNKDFPSISLSGGVKAINPSKTNIVDLFEFPVIDKIESSSVSGWTKFSNIPSPNPNNIGMINMDGYVYGRHNNGVVERDGKFETRKLGKYEINLSENLNNNTKPYTYAERRVITGLTNYSIAQWCIVKLRSIVQADDVTEETLKNIWKMLFNPTNEEDEPTNYKEILLEVIDTMTVLKQTIDEDLIIYIQCDETIDVVEHHWKIDQDNENCITNRLIQFKKFNVVDINNERQYAFTDAKKANLNIGEINENFNFDNELKLSTEIESIDVSGKSLINNITLTKLSFNQGEKEGGHYQLFALSRYRDGFYGNEDMNQYPLYNAAKTKSGIVCQIGEVQKETILSHEGEISKINDKEKKIQGTFNEEYHSPYFHSMYKFKGSNDDERVWRDAESTNGLYIANKGFNCNEAIFWTVSNDYFLNPKYIRHVYCVYVKGNMKMLSPLYEFAPTQLVGTCGDLYTYDEGTKSVIGIKVNDYARVYFKNYDYTLGGPFKIRSKKIYKPNYLTHIIPEGTIKYKDEEYYYKIVDKLEDEIYKFEDNMGILNEYPDFHKDHVIAKDITNLRHLTWTNGNELKRDEFILINWVVPESDSFRFISEQKDTETEDFVESLKVKKVYRVGQKLTRLPKNNGQYKDNDEWKVQYKKETEKGTKVITDTYETSKLLNGNFKIETPCIITKQNIIV